MKLSEMMQSAVAVLDDADAKRLKSRAKPFSRGVKAITGLVGQRVRNLEAAAINRMNRRPKIPMHSDDRKRKTLRERMTNWQSCQWIKAGRPSRIEEMKKYAQMTKVNRTNLNWSHVS